MTIETLLAFYCMLVVLASAAGGHLPSLIRMTHLKTQLLISFVGGLMLGIAVLHLLPHAVDTLGSASMAGAACLIGIIGMFLLLRAFHPPHAHGFVDATVLGGSELSSSDASETDGQDPGPHDRGHHDRGHHEPHHGCSHDEPEAPRGMAWIGILAGLWLHTVIDGVALAASTVSDAQHTGIAMAGLGTFLAIALHKPLDAFAITSTMRSSGWSPSHQAIVNVIFAIACPVGAMLFYFGVTKLNDSSLVLGWGLAISSGFFICISLGDLLPEVSFHQHDRGKLTLALLSGIGLAFLVEHLPGHSHVHAFLPEADGAHGEFASERANMPDVDRVGPRDADLKNLDVDVDVDLDLELEPIAAGREGLAASNR